MGNPKIILTDLETSPLITATWSLYPDSIQHESILQDWYIISGAWKELNGKTTYAVSIADYNTFKHDFTNDFEVVYKLREVFEGADIIIGHNVCKFDVKKFNARLIYHKLDPLPSGIHYVDTLKEVKKVAAFSSNRLDYLCKHLIGEGKIETKRGLWMEALKGSKKAIDDMKVYNKQDVVILEELYLYLRPYMKSHPSIGAMAGEDRHHSCPKCGSTEMTIRSYKFTAAGIRKVQKQCSTCHSYTTFPENSAKEKDPK